MSKKRKKNKPRVFSLSSKPRGKTSEKIKIKRSAKPVPSVLRRKMRGLKLTSRAEPVIQEEVFLEKDRLSKDVETVLSGNQTFLLADSSEGRLVLSVENEEADLIIAIGGHSVSPYVLNLEEALSERDLSEARDSELRNFWTNKARAKRRPDKIKIIAALLLGIFSDDRDYRVMSPSRPRLIEELADELLVINLAQVIFNLARVIFIGYFSVLATISRGLFRIIRRKKKFHPLALIPEKERITRVRELLKNPHQVFKLESVSWKTNLGFFHFAPPLRFERALATFVFLAFVFVLPLRIVSTYRELQNTKSVFMERSVKAFESLNNSWSQVGNLESAAAAFLNASKSFDTILSDVEETHRVLQNIASILPEGDELNAGKALLSAGSEVSAAAEVMAVRLATLGDSFISPAERVHQLGESLDTVLPLLRNARENLDKISLDLIPEEFRSKAMTAVGLLDHVIEAVESSETTTTVLEDVLGRVTPRKFLLVFQNNSEIRATGGFLGSFAEIDIDRGEITKLWMPGAGSYELQGSLRASLVPPEPLQLITDHWQFHDSNWFPDFPTSARKMMWFYEKTGGPTVDGVIALTTSVVEKILEVTGPIEMPEYGKVVTAENFLMETQKAVEMEYDKKVNKPKQFLADLAPKLLEKLQSKDPKMFFRLADALRSSIGEKHFQIYMRDQAMEDKIINLGWAGSLKQTNGDMLAVVNTNIAGEKTDAVIGEHIKHLADIDEDGKVRVTVEVTRTHHGEKGELFRGVRNVDYVRIYTPFGSKLLSAEGFKKPDASLFKSVAASAVPDPDLEAADASAIDDPISGTHIYSESGHTVFGNWIMVDPGGSVTYKLVYELPFLVSFKETEKTFLEKIGLEPVPLPQAAYSFLLIKQAGAVGTTFEHEVKKPEGAEVVWNYPERVSIPGKLDRDLFFGTVMTPSGAK